MPAGVAQLEELGVAAAGGRRPGRSAASATATASWWPRPSSPARRGSASAARRCTRRWCGAPTRWGWSCAGARPCAAWPPAAWRPTTASSPAAGWSAPTASTRRCGAGRGSRRASARHPPLRRPSTLSARAVDRQGGGLVGRRRRGLRHAGGGERGAAWPCCGAARRTRRGRVRPARAALRSADGAIPGAGRAARRGRAGLPRTRAPARSTVGRGGSGATGCCWSATPPATSTRSPARGSTWLSTRPSRWSRRCAATTRARYARFCRRLSRLPFALIRLLLFVERRPALRRRLIRTLADDPRLFRRLLAIYSRDRPPSSLGMTGAWRLARGLLR